MSDVVYRDLVRKMSSGRISRRHFIQGATALVIA